MVEADKENHGILRIVLNVKETDPILESELAKFKSLCEKLYAEKEEEENEELIGVLREEEEVDQAPPSKNPQSIPRSDGEEVERSEDWDNQYFYSK